MENVLHLAITAALQAGKAIMEIYESDDFGIEIKGDNSPLTKADLEADKIIQEQLTSTNIPILSEEGKNIPFEERKNWNQLWIVDPIDGTKEFIKRNGEFTVNIALIENQIPILGVVYAPALQEIYFASKEIGSFKVHISPESQITKRAVNNMIQSANSLPLKSTRTTYTVVASRSHLSPETVDFIKELEKEHGEVNSISKGSSLKLCMVAEGTADCYPRFAPTMEWDTAAGQTICMYAGFDVMDWNTKNTMKYNREQLLNNWFLVK